MGNKYIYLRTRSKNNKHYDFKNIKVSFDI